MARSAAVVATGRYLPERLVSNDELRSQLATSGHADIIARLEAGSGIRQRYRAAPDQATSDLAVAAARKALDRAGCRAGDLDLIILGTDTPDRITPATSVIVQAKLGATGAGTLDIGCACASFPTALATATGLIATNRSLRRVMVIGAYMMQRLADPDDPMIFFYGDGAGAALMMPTDGPGLVTSAFLADGRYADDWGIAAGGTAEPASHDAVAAGRTRVRVKRRYPPSINEQGWPRIMRRLATQGDFPLATVNQAVFTQINAASIDNACATLDLAPERAPKLMDRYGYTGSACIPIALDHIIEHRLAGAGDLVTLVGSGVGYNMAGVALRLEERTTR
ncbi:3-oxoacyl-ACP synthase III family protein [Spiribacter vilamensis]|uniref:3-oxoacyl-[acyl-carrier-protein] synthase-3 n=1 Tax=Spiribacter vilamensis TaxID=531306 RepID=A0A4Q8D2C5_9GAMM|nr:ketoacyl-ACP synthase III [Spiribacter vilamensis]RZU99484.1 3-oxoacyl-[acyl-carrier-protein] synthase-3 [Spiribacter vilamensis]TVO61544.1 ketoacyl-ACP synthase III [Spiribacter vilamensis]